MKKLLTLLLLLLFGPAMAQEYVNPYAGATQTGNLVPDFSFDGPTGQTPDGWVLQGDNQSGGAIQVGCGALSNQGKCFIFSYMGATLSTTIDLSQYNTNSFEFYFDFFYRMNCNNSIGGSCENPDGPRDLFGASVQFFTTNGEAGSFNFIPIGPDYFTAGDPGVNEFGYKPVGWYSSQQSEFLFTSAIISFYGRDEGFWAGYYGPALDRVNFSIGYLEAPDPVIGIDCTLNPYDPNCIINTLDLYDDGIIDYSDPVEVAEMLAEETTDENTGSDDGSIDGTEIIEDDEEEILVADTDEEMLEELQEELLEDEQELQELLAETTIENNVTSRELTDEEKAQILADAISKATLENALAVANTAASSTTTTSETTTATTTVAKRVDGVEEVGETIQTNVEEETIVADIEEQSQDMQAGDMSDEILLVGISMNEATQKENEISIDASIDEANLIAEQSSSSSTTTESPVEFVTDTTSNIEALDFVTASIEAAVTGDVTEQSIIENIVNNSNDKTFKDDEDTEFLATVIDSSNPSQIMSIVQPFNFEPSVADREQAGVLGKKEEDKSDAEKRAEEVVAANKEQQDEINKNYMDADQSGIVAAMGADTDVSSYRSAMLNDNNIWYKPEDIYKNVVYKDNVRGAYFLEKGNSDTYKKMVEEQYK